VDLQDRAQEVEAQQRDDAIADVRRTLSGGRLENGLGEVV